MDGQTDGQTDRQNCRSTALAMRALRRTVKNATEMQKLTQTSSITTANIVELRLLMLPGGKGINVFTSRPAFKANAGI